MTKDWQFGAGKWFYAAAGDYVVNAMGGDEPAAIIETVKRNQEFYSYSITEDSSGSAIEAMLLAHLLFSHDGYNDLIFDPFPGQNPAPEFGTTFTQQHSVSRYRVDFFFTVHCRGKTRHLVVECDGHDFHEKTKEQAKRDKERDREFVRLGYSVLHFTGSEIFKDTSACVDEISTVLASLAEEIIPGGDA